MPLLWRENLHKVIKHILPEYKDGIPGIIIDSIDAAYVQGLEDMTNENEPIIKAKE